MNTEDTEGLTLWVGDVQVRQGHLSGRLPCRVSFDLHRANTLDFEITGTLSRLGRPFSFDDNVFVVFPNVTNEVECYIRSHRFGSGGDSATLCPRFSKVHLDSGVDLTVVHAGVVNFAPFVFGRPGQTNACNLTSEGWAVSLSPVPAVVEYPGHVQSTQYQFTHLARISRTDEKRFSGEKARLLLEELCQFLSFCNQRWVSTAFAYGIGCDGELAYQEWGTGQVSVMSTPDGWLDLYHGSEMIDYFPSFMGLLRKPSQAEMVKFVLYWFIRADTNLVGPDGACILLQTALERIAWQILVNDRRALSRKGFGDLSAADQLRLLFSYLEIPLSVPTELEDLYKLANARGLDGPEMLTFIRNRIVHPPKNEGQAEHYPFYQAYSLAKWFVELSLLKLGGFCGRYHNRTRKRRWRGQVEELPWASTTTSSSIAP